METERLIFKLYEESDKDTFITLLTDETVMKYVDNGVFTQEKAEALWQKLIKDLYGKGVTTIYAVFDKLDGRYIGSASIRPRPSKEEEWEIVYILKTEEWGKGYATEIAAKLIEFGFDELNLKDVYATVDIDNFGSIHVLEKAGMKHIRDEYDQQGKFYVYGIISENIDK